ncbi:MAG TPA: hypothetical protein VG826_36160 [Pirellulales bacterium]|nr:hypothetical protein [Pirellulales bacterium]
MRSSFLRSFKSTEASNGKLLALGNDRPVLQIGFRTQDEPTDILKGSGGRG